MTKQELQQEGLAWLAAQIRWEGTLIQLRRSAETPAERPLALAA